MIKAQQLRRLCFLTLLLTIAYGVLAWRLVDLQVVRHEELSLRAASNTKRAVLFVPRRGDIRDARGNLLATSLPAKTVCADPSLLGNRQGEVARAIAPLLQMEEAKVQDLLGRVWRTNSLGLVVTNRYVVLKRRVPVETWQAIQGAMTNLNFGLDGKKLTKSEARFYRELRCNAIFADPVEDQWRIYPNQRLAAHILGFTGLHETEANGKPIIETVGLEGIERTMDQYLKGVRGWRVTEKDRRNRELVFLREQDVEPADGLNVVLTVDAGVQYIVESELAEAARQHRPDSITCLAVRPRTGAIVAMATLPNFDPNMPGQFPPEARRNRIITDVNEPGSTFKIVVVAGALNDGLVKLTDVFHCENGHFPFAGHVLHDHKPYGPLSVEAIVTKSSNIGAAKIGIRLGPARLYEHIQNFGFGSLSGVPLPGEVKGLVYPPAKWSKVSIAQIPMGHGLAVTQLQMTMAMCAIANQGLMMRPLLVERLEDQEGRAVFNAQPQPVRRVLSPEAAAQMVRALKTVVSKEGTAYKARIEHYTAAGKTGTAQKPENGGYSHEKFYSSFIGFFPADDPELCVSVVMDYPKDSHYGGETCAPVFARIAERAANYLNVRPDQDADMEPDRKLARVARGAIQPVNHTRPVAGN